MNNFNVIIEKLEAFIKRFYLNELLKGSILFFSIGLLYFLFTLFIEYTLWLSTGFRSFLFWFFILVELLLFVNFIVLPLAKLFKLKSGIDYKYASKLIGKHFPEVNDKLLNVLQLQEHPYKSELLLASIEQKSVELNPIPFKLAVNFKTNFKHLKFAAIPVLILLLTFFTGHVDWFTSSYERIINYNTAYLPPAPFKFYVLNSHLNAIENKDFKLIVKTAGSVVPQNVQIVFNDETYFLQQTDVGTFEYVFSQPKQDIDFKLISNNVQSSEYVLNVIQAPSILGFKMLLNYPAYTNKSLQVLHSSGNAIVPEGTSISWLLQTKSTSKVSLISKDTVLFSSNNKGLFSTKKRVFNDFSYAITTSNAYLNNYEDLAFKIKVVKDEFPEIKVDSKLDTLDLQTLYFHGQVSDDYGFTNLQLVYYPSDNQDDKNSIKIPYSNSNISEFVSVFPNHLNIKDGVSYTLFFQVTDNDQVNNFKSVKSSFFTYRKRTQSEEIQKQLDQQKSSVNALSNSLERFDDQQKQLESISKTQKEKSRLDFNDKKKLESFLKRQEQQDQMMKSFNEKMKQNIQEFQNNSSKDDMFKKDLEKRLQDNEDKLKQDEELLDELKKLQNKISNEQFSQKLEELAKQNKNKKRSLEQILELTKRFYIEKKLEALQNDLEQLSKKQEQLSNAPKEENNKSNQDELNTAFEAFKKSLQDLKKESDQLKSPIDIPRDELDEKSIDNDQQKASESLEKNNDNSYQKAQESQKSASKKMKQMAAGMKMSMGGAGATQMQEDVDMLRQILDNLLLFSFNQEALMKSFQSITDNHSKYASYLRYQSHLKEHFEHVDDSLFAISLRQPKISEQVNNDISDVFYNIDKALIHFADNNLYQGISNQQFVITSANNLADFLSEMLDNLQEQLSMSSSGQGSPGDMQLPDIIMSQEQLNQMMQDGMEKGKDGKPQEGKEGEKGESNTDGKDGKNGSKPGEQGNSSKSNSNGQGKHNGMDLENNSQLLFEIYQKQQQLREALEQHLNKIGNGNTADSKMLIKQMERIELDLLNNGLTNQTLKKMLELKHQLLKLENATFEQDQDSKRQSNSNTLNYSNDINNQIYNAKKYFNIDEILYRQNLPLKQIYRKRVTDYFIQNDDKF